MSNSSPSRALDGTRCPCRGTTLDRLLHPALLAALAAEAQHGYRLVRSVAALPVLRGCRPDPAGLYRTLRAMERGGYVASMRDASSRGPARRLYRITPAGRDCLRQWVDTLDRYHRAVRVLLREARRAVTDRRRRS